MEKEKKKVKWWKILILNLSAILLILIIVVVLILQLDTTGVNKEKEFKKSYKNISSQILEKNSDFLNVPVTEIAMLGSHDALSYEINRSSKNNSSEDIGLMETVGNLAKGMAVRISKAQNHDIYTQLCQGVRYIDMRITNIDGEFYTSHNFISCKLIDCMNDILKFLSETKGEFLLLDICHLYPQGCNWDELATYLSEIKYEGKNIYDYINYDVNIKPNKLTYAQATNSGSLSSCMFILAEEVENTDYAPFEDVNNEFRKYFNFKAIDSLWHNKPTTDEIYTKMSEHIDYLKENPFEGFRVNQAQTTPSPSNIGDLIFKWSLLKGAQTHNVELLKKIDIKDTLKYMPIYMVDYTTSTYKDFNYNINDAVIEYNCNLKV